MQIKTFQIRPDKDYLEADQNALNDFLSVISVKKTATQYVSAQTDYWSVLVFYENAKSAVVNPGNKISFPLTVDLTEEEKKIYETLKEWRFDKAVEYSTPSYVISTNAELIAVAKTKPQSAKDLLKIKGFGDHKVSKYGKDIIAVLNSVS